MTGLAQYLTQAWAVGKLRGAGAPWISTPSARLQVAQEGAVRKTAAAIERARPRRKTWRCETDPATGRRSLRTGPRGDTWPKPPDAAARPSSARMASSSRAWSRLRRQGEWEEECACQGINPWDA